MGVSDDIYYDCALQRELEPAFVQSRLTEHAARLTLSHTPVVVPDAGGGSWATIGAHADDLSAWCRPQGLTLIVRDAVVHRMDAHSLASMLFGLSVELDLVIGRTMREGGRMSIHADEVAPGGALTGLDWFNYFGPSIAGRWPVGVWQPFRTMRGGNGAIALLLGEPLSPRIRDAAAALGVALRPIYGRNPATGELFRLGYP